MITLRALGNAEIETSVTTITPSQEIVFAAALYLILERGQRVSRTRLTSLLWPSAAEKVGAHRLRQTILQLKKLGIIVQADRNNLQLLQHDARTDLDSPSAANASLGSASVPVEFLPGYTPRCSESFRDWVDAHREEVHAVVTQRLVTEINTARTKGDWQTCDRLARQCLKLDPFNESAVLAQAEASAMRGAKTQAIQLIDRYLVDVGSHNPNLSLSASVLRRRITDRMPEREPIAVRECSFVGRDHETETLTLELLAARHGRGGARLIRGEAGIGKSRLASELIKFAVLEGVQTSRTACRRSDVDRPLSVFVDLVPQLSELRGALGCSQETMSVLKGITEFDGRAAFNSLSVDDSISAHARMRAALFDLLDAIADERSVLIVVDDVQWLDASSTRLFAELLPWAKTRKVFFVLTERPGTEGLASHFSPDDLRLLPLGPLGPQFGEAIMTEVLKESPQPTSPELIHRLLSVGEGNPFFLQELGNHWLETGNQRESPPSVTAIIDERLSRVSSEALLVLQACAVLDVNATIERVEGVMEYPSHVLLSAVQELSLAGMLRSEPHTSPESAEPLSVAHDLISTASLKRLARAPLAFLHRRAGMVLERETLGDGARTAVLWACAFHWQHAGDRERAFRAACSCAEHLLTVGLPRDAVLAFERVLDYCLTDDQRLLAFSRLAISLQSCGRWEESKDVLRKARSLQARTTPNATAHDDVELALFETRWRATMEHAALVEDLKACAISTDASASHRVACFLLALKVGSEQNQMDALKELYLTIAPLLSHPTIDPATRLETEMIYHSSCGDMQAAEQAADQLRSSIKAQRDPRTFSRALGNVGAAYRSAGRNADAEAVFLELLDHTVAHGLVNRTSFAICSLIRVYIANGDLARARATLQTLETLTEGDQSLYRTADRFYFATRLALEEGNIQEAVERYSVLVSQAFHPSMNWRATVLALGVTIAVQRQALVETLRPMVLELEAVHLKTRSSGAQDFEAHALALGLHHCGESAEALRLLTEYATLYRRERWALPKPLHDLLCELRGSSGLAN